MKRHDKNFISINERRCDLCGTCVGVCPENVIRLSINKLFIDHNGCTRCLKCVWVCPVTALELMEYTDSTLSVSL